MNTAGMAGSSVAPPIEAGGTSGLGDTGDLDQRPGADTCPDDNDGLSDAEEAAAGLDPCNPDTNGDGCIDGAEVKLGGCSPENGVLIGRCYAEPDDVFVTFTAPPRDGGVWSSLTLRENVYDHMSLALEIAAVSSIPGVGLNGPQATYSNVPAGTSLKFRLNALPSHLEGEGVIGIELIARDSADAGTDAGAPQVVARGKVLVLVRLCPIPL